MWREVRRLFSTPLNLFFRVEEAIRCGCIFVGAKGVGKCVFVVEECSCVFVGAECVERWGRRRRGRGGEETEEKCSEGRFGVVSETSQDCVYTFALM